MFYREAEKALAAVDHIVDIARDIRTLKGAHLRIIAPMLTAFGILPAAIAAFRGSHPHTPHREWRQLDGGWDHQGDRPVR